jgi:hypothetical protein
VPTAPNVDTSAPHPARVYDYWLGGKDNFEADRQAAQAAMEIFPYTVQSARACRRYLARVVRFLTAEQGIRQFLDIGTGPDQVTGYFDGLELVPPGVVQISQWRPDSAYDSDLPAALWGGVARKA